MKVKVKPNAVNATISRWRGDASHKGVRAGILAKLDGVPYDDPADREAVRTFYTINAETPGRVFRG
jgi:hypothetical protein